MDGASVKDLQRKRTHEVSASMSVYLYIKHLCVFFTDQYINQSSITFLYYFIRKTSLFFKIGSHNYGDSKSEVHGVSLWIFFFLGDVGVLLCFLIYKLFCCKSICNHLISVYVPRFSIG